MVKTFALALISFFPMISSTEKKAVDEKTYDLPGIIEYFALNTDDVATIQSWGLAKDSKSPVKWEAGEPQWDAASSTYTKTGSAPITVNGTPMDFTVILSGTKIVVNKVQLNLAKSPTIGVYEFEKMLNAAGIITYFIKCDNMMPKSYGTLAYSISILKKKETWVAYTWQCLKGECSANFSIYYEKEKVEKLPCY